MKIVLFAVIGTAMLLPVKYFSELAGRTYREAPLRIVDMKRNQVRSGEIIFDNDKTSVVFMGDSRVLFGIIPERFDEAAGGGVSSYNLSLPALPIGPNYFMLSDLLSSGVHPDYIILQLTTYDSFTHDLFDRIAIQGVSSTSEIWEYSLKLKNRSMILNYYFPMRMYEREIVKYSKSLVVDRENIEKIRTFNIDELEKIRKARGYYHSDRPHGRKRDSDTDVVLKVLRCDFDRDESPPYADPFLKMFFDLALENNLKVILISPSYLENQCSPHEIVPRQYAKVIEDYNNVYIAENGWQRKFYPEKYFSDPLHLNSQGAFLHTDNIAREFVEIHNSLQQRKP